MTHGGFCITKEYDLIIIGSGVAAQTVVYHVADAGWKVALIEERRIGGTCALRGCIPKKVLVGAADVISRVEGMKDNGINVENISIDWEALIKFKNSFTEPKPETIENNLRDAGVDIYKNHATFQDETTIKVGDTILSAKHVLIATGQKPRPLKIPGDEHVITSDDFFHLQSLPQTIVFIGGGYISFELAHIAAQAGSTVTILHQDEMPLMQFEEDLVKKVMDASEHIGIKIHVNHQVHSVEKHEDTYQVIAGDDNTVFDADLVVHGAGRIPNIDGLHLENANVAYNKRGIKVNGYMQSISNPNIYAAGDVSDTDLPLTPVAAGEGRIIVKNLLGDEPYPSDICAIPSAVFTTPPLASVGLTEKEAKEKNYDYTVSMNDTSSWYVSKRTGIIPSAFKIIIDTKTNQILGAHLLGHHAEEVINIFALAIRHQITKDHLRHMIWTYPTSSYDINYML